MPHTLLDLLHRRLLRYLAASGLMLFADAPAGETAPAADGATGTAPAAEPTAAATTPPAAGAEPTATATAAGETQPADGAAKPAGEAQEPPAEPVKTAEALAAEQAAELTQLHESWKTEAAADPEFGGAKFEENLATAQAAMKASTTEKLQVLLARTGLDSHPEMIRHFLRVAPAFRHDKFVPNGDAPLTERSAAKALYPTAS